MATKKTPAAIEAAAKRSRATMLEAASPKRRTLPAKVATSKGVVTTPAQPKSDDRARFVFIAYAREDEAAATAVVSALEARGILVKWDRDLLGGQHFRMSLGRMIAEAAVVLVLWSAHSAASDFVIDEAEAGKSAGKLVTCRLADLDERDIPFGFRQLHCVDADDPNGILAALAVLGLTPMPS
jgi:hypothetical protein